MNNTNDLLIRRRLINTRLRYRDNARPVAQGAATSCYVAAHPSPAEISGKYFADCRLAEPGTLQANTVMASRLWHVSEKLTGAWLKAG